MKIFNNYKQFPQKKDAVYAITIGNFDGVHLGHQAILNRLKQNTHETVVLTFSNHPSEVIHGTSTTRLSTLSHRLQLLCNMGIAYVILLSFTKAFSQQTASAFLSTLKNAVPFNELILGYDSRIGNDRKSDLSDLAEELNFSLEYLEPVYVNGAVVSSSVIRKCIIAGQLDAASAFLGRPYSIFASVERGKGKGGLLGFHTANLPVDNLALPPLGVYAVEVKIDHAIFLAVANLGYAPTLHTNRPACLEVHLIDDSKNLYGKELEVFFLKYLRPEKRFESIDALKTQIQHDIQQAKTFHSVLLQPGKMV